MKKILALLLILASITLASCGKKKDDTKRIDQPGEAIALDLKLEEAKNGVRIVDVNTSKKEYYDIRMANDAHSTLFVYNVMLDEQFETHGNLIRDAQIKPLIFTANIYEEETVKICSTVFDSKEGITKEELGVSFDIMARSSWVDSINLEDSYNAYVNDGVKNNCVSIVYLPLFVEHVEDSKSVLEIYVMMPVYYELTTCADGVISSTAFDGLAVKEFVFTEDYLLSSLK
ncbi:MAG: hypothetical protein E7176_03065 [Erysipelotrichaceae bacterium]|nr:hypothetical protein [Erysipelotrichaceae bacterium]